MAEQSKADKIRGHREQSVKNAKAGDQVQGNRKDKNKQRVKDLKADKKK